MIYKLLCLLCCSLILFLSPIKACDVCGASASNLGLGLLSDYRNNFIRLSYFHTAFQSNPAPDRSVSDLFQQWDISFRYQLGKRFRLMGQIPFAQNTRSLANKDLKLSGLSDIRVLASYVLFADLAIGQQAAGYLEIGGGCKLPTGRYDAQIHDRNLPENFNLGQGSFGYILQMRMAISQQAFGLIFNQNYQQSGQTSIGYQFGQQYNAQLTVFREWTIGQIQLVPNIGCSAEIIHKDQYANRQYVTGTGGKGMFFSSALHLKTEKWLAGFSYVLPVIGNYSDKAVDPGKRISCQFTLFF